MWVYDSGTVEGMGTGVVRGDGCYLRSMAVDPRARGRGIGDVLVETVLRWASDQGIARVRLHTTPFGGGTIVGVNVEAWLFDGARRGMIVLIGSGLPSATRLVTIVTVCRRRP